LRRRFEIKTPLHQLAAQTPHVHSQEPLEWGALAIEGQAVERSTITWGMKGLTAVSTNKLSTLFRDWQDLSGWKDSCDLLDISQAQARTRAALEVPMSPAVIIFVHSQQYGLKI